MKIKINYFLFKLVKENFVYLFSFIIIVLVFIVSVTIVFNKFNAASQKIDLTDKEIVDLKKKVELVNYKQEIIQEGIDIEQVNKVLTKLIPNEEDFFSVIFALEEISKKTNFLIISYSIDLKATTADKLALTISGRGDQNTFFNFLRDYRFIGGRLITVDKIDYKTTGFAEIKLNINFFAGKSSEAKSSSVKLTEKDKQLVKEILSKVKLELKSENENLSYPVKSNPF